MTYKTQKKGAQKTSAGASKGGAPVANNQWVKDAMAGTYDYHTGGGGKKGTKPGFSKRGSVTANQDKMRKGAVPTHGTDGAC